MSSTSIDQRQTQARPADVPGPRLAPNVAPTPQGFIKRHPLLMFFAIAFAISFVGILLVVELGDVQGAVAPATDPRFLLMMLAWLAGPSIASIVMTGLVSGRSGYLQSLRQADNLARWPWLVRACAIVSAARVRGAVLRSVGHLA
jgi:hypothetical protein